MGLKTVLMYIPVLLFHVTAEIGRRNLLRNVGDELLIDETSHFNRFITVIRHVGCWGIMYGERNISNYKYIARVIEHHTDS